MKNIFALVLALLLSVEAWGGSTYKADLYTSSLQNTATELKSQNRTTNGVGNSTLVSGGNALGAGNVGGDVVVDGGVPGAGALKGQLISNTLLKFGTAPDSANGHIRNNSNTPIMIVDQSNQSAFLGAFAGAFSGTYTGNQNTGIGHQTLTNLTSGQSNTAIGYQAMQPWTDGSSNVAVGAAALSSSSSGNENVAVGAQAMNNATNGASQNVAVGRQSGFSIDGGENVMVGHRAGLDGNAATTVGGDTFVGARAGLGSATQRNFATAIGYDAKVDCDNCAVIGRTTDFVGVGVIAPSLAGGIQSLAGIRLGSNANYIDVSAGAGATNYSIELPPSAPLTGQVLKKSPAPNLMTWELASYGVVSGSNVVLTADNQSVTLAGIDVQGIESDDPVPANRTFVLDTPIDGQVVTFIWVGANAGELIDDSAIGGAGNVRLNGDWLPQATDTITLRCAAVTGGNVDCYETARSDNN